MYFNENRVARFHEILLRFVLSSIVENSIEALEARQEQQILTRSHFEN